MSCPSDDTFGQWLDGALDDPAAERMSAHAAECADCRELAQHLRTRRALGRPAAASSNLVLGRYQVGAKLGQGARGTIVAATDTKTGRRVALKSLRNQVDSSLVTKFAREARLLAKVKSPHVVEFVEAGFDDDGEPVLVMARVEGDSLEERLARGGPMSPKVVVEYLQQLCDGLGAIHAAGIIHRDLKLTNVLVERRAGGEVLTIVDFGVAREVGAPASSAEPAIVGTPYYVSPEQVDDPSSVDGRVDIWALGVCAYRMLTGRYPYEGKTAWETFAKLERAEPVRLDAARPGIAPGLARVVERCLEPDRERRYADAASLAFALALAFEPTATPPPRARSSFAKMAMFTSALFILIGFLGAWLATWIRAGR